MSFKIISKHEHGKFSDASEEDYESSEDFCRRYAVDPPRLLPSSVIDNVRDIGCSAWGITHPNYPRFVGQIYKNTRKGGLITVRTTKQRKESCLLSDLPIVAALYESRGKVGIYYEICIDKMDGIIAVGQ